MSMHYVRLAIVAGLKAVELIDSERLNVVYRLHLMLFSCGFVKNSHQEPCVA